MSEFRAALGKPGLYRLPLSGFPQLQPGLFSTGDLVQDPEGAGLYPFVEIGATTPALLAVPDGSPMPYIDVVADQIPTEAYFITVWRHTDGRWMPVRSGVGVRNVGAWTTRDFEAAPGYTHTYRLQYYAKDGLTLGFSDSATVTMPEFGPSLAWFHDPLDPQSGVLVSLRGATSQPIVRTTSGSAEYVPGRSVGIAFPSTRTGVQSIVLDCVTETAEEAKRFDALFGAYDSDALSIVCVRADPRTRFPAPLFAFVPETERVLRDYDTWAEWWALEGTEVAPPTPAVITPLLTYQDFTNFYSTYEEFSSAYLSYLDASRDYSVKETG